MQEDFKKVDKIPQMKSPFLDLQMTKSKLP